MTTGLDSSERPQTIPDLLASRANKTPDAVAYWSLDATGTWQPVRWGAHARRVAALAGAFRDLGLGPGDRLAIMAPSSLHWETAQMAALACGATVLGVDSHDRSERVTEILELTSPAALVVGSEQVLEDMPAVRREALRFVVAIERPTRETSEQGPWWLDALVERGSGPDTAWRSDARADDQAAIVFTSGTTGGPKGISYTHAQVSDAVRAILETYSDITPGSRLVCWLPMSNLFQWIVNICAIAHAASTHFVSDPREIMHHLRDIDPDIFLGVPRFFEKLHAGIQAEVERRPPWQQALVGGALRIGAEVARAHRAGERAPPWKELAHTVTDRLVLARLRAMMGPSLPYVISGSAPMPAWLLDAFDALGLPVLEAYGLSENILPVAANTVRHARRGTVGKPVRGSEIALGEDGELLIRGPGVFRGYYGASTEEAAPEPGAYLRTGDYAEIDTDGFITLTGRKSEVFKTSTGRRVAPARIEGCLRHIPYIEHAAVFGASRPFLIAVLVLAEGPLETALGVPATDAAGAPSEAALTMVRFDVAREAAALVHHERPAGLVVTFEPLSIEGGELTANLKLRRDAVASRFDAPIERLYTVLGAERAKVPRDSLVVEAA